MATELSNAFLQRRNNAEINFGSDSFKINLMATGFTFNRDTHDDWADVSASELAAGNGYTQNTKVLAGVNVGLDDTNDRSDVTWSNAVWTASGGSIGPSPGAIIIDDTHANDAIVGYIDFGGDQTATDGGTFTVSNIIVRSAGQ